MKLSNRTILTLTLIMVLTSSIAFAVSPVKGPVLYFNPLETRQEKGDNAWKNAGKAGGEIKKGEGKPTLEVGALEIPSIGLKADNAAWYTATRSKAVFANEVDDAKAPVVNLESFTIWAPYAGEWPIFRRGEHHYRHTNRGGDTASGA